jgi:NAD-dependent dihydropyrimidine dehydrogenase PreA subunit
MALREVVRIDEELCDGCGECVPSCLEGAIAIVDGKARLVDEALCDGLGACLGHCPQGAITIVQADATPFDEALVRAAPRAPVVPAMPFAAPGHGPVAGCCPGSRAAVCRGRIRGRRRAAAVGVAALAGPAPPDPPVRPATAAPTCCSPPISGARGRRLPPRLPGQRALAIACPKPDPSRMRTLLPAALIDGAEIRSLTVAVMEVPCCGGLVRLAQAASAQARRSVPLRVVVVGVQGQVLAEQELPPAQPAAARPSLPSLG